jgi:hypothetical protein
MVLMYTIAVIKDRTTVYKKVPYDCLSYKQKLHNGILKYNIKRPLLTIIEKLKNGDLENYDLENNKIENNE